MAPTSYVGPQVQTLIIGGTAAYGLDLTPYHPIDAAISYQTPYGLSPPVTFLRPPGRIQVVAFCSRHGLDRLGHSAAFVNHRALIWTARLLGARSILSWNGVGAIATELEVGDLVVPHDFLDFTRTRVTSFDRSDLIAARGPAFDPQVRNMILQAAAAGPHKTHTMGVYVCTEGPRLETRSEIALYDQAGADIVGMTLSPEVFLSQELDLAYASLCYITNYATGRAGSRPARRQFGPDVAHTCLPILLAACQTQPSTMP